MNEGISREMGGRSSASELKGKIMSLVPALETFHFTESRLFFNYEALLSEGFFPTIPNSHLILRVTLTACQLREATIESGIDLEKTTDL